MVADLDDALNLLGAHVHVSLLQALQAGNQVYVDEVEQLLALFVEELCGTLMHALIS